MPGPEVLMPGPEVLMHRPPDLAVFGAGSWGTALAIAWARTGQHVALWGRTPAKMEALAATRRHPRLGEVELPPTLRPVVHPEELFEAPLWISVLPTQASPGVWEDFLQRTKRRPEHLIHSSKGILAQGHRCLSEALGPLFEAPVGVLSGPTFADEVALGMPSAIVLGLPEAIGEHRARELQHRLATDRLRVYLSRDVIGAELCGALKNVLAIAAGLVEGLGLGHNARAALITRGLAEMSRLVAARGGKAETMMGLAGMGDLLLTATGPQSRNRRLGAYLAEGRSLQEATEAMGGQVIEGVSTTAAALALARESGLELPIAQEVGNLLAGEDPHLAVERLMKRSLKSE